jgi:hypothetical protein
VGGTIKTHLVHALSLDDGSELAGWPVDVSTLQHGSLAFDPVAENQRGAVVIAGSTLYVPYSGHASDCPHNGVYYHGWVIGVPLDDPAGATAWATGAQQSGIWGPGGLASDGAGVFAVTGNAGDMETAQTPWQHQEAILRFQAGPVFSGQTADYFAPFNWAALDANDLDLGGSGVLLVDVPGATPSQIAVAFGKDGKAYLADRTNLGGIGPVTGGPPVLVSQVAGSQIIGAPAWYTTASGVYVTLVVYNGQQTAGGCPAGQSGDLMALKIVPGAPPTLTTAWCQNSNGHGSPTVTAAGGDTLVWTVGAETTGHLYAFDGDTGTPVYTSKETMPQLTRFIVPIAVHGRIIVGGNGKAYAFKP